MGEFFTCKKGRECGNSCIQKKLKCKSKQKPGPKRCRVGTKCGKSCIRRVATCRKPSVTAPRKPTTRESLRRQLELELEEEENEKKNNPCTVALRQIMSKDRRRDKNQDEINELCKLAKAKCRSKTDRDRRLGVCCEAGVQIRGRKCPPHHARNERIWRYFQYDL